MQAIKEISFMEQTPASRAVTNAGTFAVQAAQSGNWTARTVGNGGAVIDFAGQNATSPANSWLIGGQFNTTPTTITSGNSSPLQLDANGNLLVNIKAGAGSGGTALADGGAFTAGSTNTTPSSGFYQSSPTTCTTGTACAVGLTTNREFKTAVTTMLDQPGGTSVMDTTNHAVNVTIKAGGSNSVTDAATQTTGATSVATTESYGLGYDSTNSVYTRIYVDPCQSGVKTYTPISLTASGQVLAGTSSKKTYVCHLELVTATAQNIALVEGTGTVCATSIAGMAGGTTAATGWNFAANGGINSGNGASSVYAEATAADNICLLLSSTGQTSGVLVTAVR